MLKNKNLLSILFLILQFSLFAEETITYKVATKSDVYSYPEKECYKNAKSIGNAIITNYPPTINFLSTLDSDIQAQCLFYVENNQKYAISTRNIRIMNSDSLPQEKFNYDSTGLTQMVIPAYYLEVLANQNPKQILEYEKTFARYIAKNSQTATLGRRIHNCPDEFSAIVSPLHISLNSGDEIYFKHITKISDSVYECVVACSVGYTTENHDYSENFWQVYVDNTSEGQTEIFTITIDGDYLRIDNKTRLKHIVTLVYVDDSLIKSLEKLFIEGKSELSKVIWPRHADGSCDYDGSKTTTAIQTVISTSSTNVTKNKTMTVNENLKLRSGEATSTQVLSVMAAGSKVKILELGKSETIDGIPSNWVKVEVQKGAKDRDGNSIKAGTVGWCYGGFLE